LFEARASPIFATNDLSSAAKLATLEMKLIGTAFSLASNASGGSAVNAPEPAHQLVEHSRHMARCSESSGLSLGSRASSSNSTSAKQYRRVAAGGRSHLM
jgi:hypothetical protein